MATLDSTEIAEVYLVQTDATDFCHMYPLRKRKSLTIGRGGRNRVVLKDERSSREHCRIRWYRGDWYVFDLESSNGTLVNGVRIAEYARLEPGDVLTVGRTDLRLTSRTQLMEEDMSLDMGDSLEFPRPGFDGTTVMPPQ